MEYSAYPVDMICNYKTNHLLPLSAEVSRVVNFFYLSVKSHEIISHIRKSSSLWESQQLYTAWSILYWMIEYLKIVIIIAGESIIRTSY